MNDILTPKVKVRLLPQTINQVVKILFLEGSDPSRQAIIDLMHGNGLSWASYITEDTFSEMEEFADKVKRRQDVDTGIRGTLPTFVLLDELAVDMAIQNIPDPDLLSLDDEYLLADLDLDAPVEITGDGFIETSNGFADMDPTLLAGIEKGTMGGF